MNIIVLLVSLSMTIYMSWQIYQSISLKYFSNKTEGTITDYFTRKGYVGLIGNRKSVYAPVFKYKDDYGQEHEIITTNYKRNMKYKKGDFVTVYYNSDNPKIAQIDDSFPWVGDIFLWTFGVLGVIFTLGPILNGKV